MAKQVRNETAAEYQINPAVDLNSVSLEQLIKITLERIEQSMTREMYSNSPKASADYLSIKYSTLEHEIFGVMWLDQQHGLLATEELFRGTVNQASVFVREVVKSGLAHNAAAAVLFHNHPSGRCSPSHADRHITNEIKQAFELIDIRLLDHLIVGGGIWHSFAEAGDI